ncbi:hypothetical protein [Vibrio alfacsensis]|uniref:hypothetical protein n=1 Tax=Vibrio alfacsensis TaxID=1074311 RepID=UPI004067637F
MLITVKNKKTNKAMNKTIKQYEKNLRDNQKEYVRVVSTPNGMEVQVHVPTWKGPHEINCPIPKPVVPGETYFDDEDWHVYSKIGFECDGDYIMKVVERASLSTRFFFTCNTCSLVKNVFFEASESLCRDCAPIDDGIVY